jgi:hypothetical protein
MSSLRSGPGRLSLKNPSKAKLRKIGEIGRQTAKSNRTYSKTIPF